jgi:hypothetical protein
MTLELPASNWSCRTWNIRRWKLFCTFNIEWLHRCVYWKCWKHFLKIMANAFISPFNTQTMHIKSFYTHRHCYVSLKPYTLAGFELGSSWGGCDFHCATPPGRKCWK